MYFAKLFVSTEKYYLIDDELEKPENLVLPERDEFEVDEQVAAFDQRVRAYSTWSAFIHDNFLY